MTALAQANIGLIFGTDTGNTEEIGTKIADSFASYGCGVEMVNVIDASAEVIAAFDCLIMGIPTWDFGGIQEDWEAFEEDIIASQLDGKLVALYGLGDQLGYGDYFVDAMGWLHEKLQSTGATIVGAWSTEGYDFEESRALNHDRSKFCGLAIDEDQQFELTDQRITQWVAQVVAQAEVMMAA